MEAVSNAWHSLAIKPEKMRERGGEKTEEKTGETERKGDPGQEKKTRRQTKRENRERPREIDREEKGHKETGGTLSFFFRTPITETSFHSSEETEHKKKNRAKKFTDERRGNRGQESRGRRRNSSFLATDAFTDLRPRR